MNDKLRDQCWANVVSITEEVITIKSFDGATYALPSNSDERSYGCIGGNPFIKYPDGVISEGDEGQLLFYDDGSFGFAPKTKED